MDLSRIVDEIIEEEGYRGLLYDDKTGKPLKAGDTIQGNPTIACGWNVSAKPVSKQRARIITTWFVQDAYDELLKTFPWIADHPAAIQEALTDMSYNLGIQTLSSFTVFLGLVKDKQYKAASEDLEKTLWAKQVGPSRSHNIEDLINNG